MITYSSTLPCPQVSGYGTTQEGKTKYLGGKTVAIQPRISMTLVAKTRAELLALADFYYNDINGGVDTFLAKWVFEGISDHLWTVKIVGGFDTSYPFAMVGEKKITVEIQDDVAAIVREALIRQQILGA
jgi:hypothetical protein